MIPEFEKEGYLPPGIHLTTIDEFEKRFVYSIKRKDQFSCLIKLINDLKSIGCKSIYIDGSFVTNKRIPGDIDICWDESGVDIDKAVALLPMLNDRKLQKSIYQADLFPAFCTEGS